MPYQGRLPYTYKSPYNYTLDQGTQTVPSLAFLGDTNNGLFSPATDTVAITTNGSEKLRVTDTGNVGIGTTNPNCRFQAQIQTTALVNGDTVNSYRIARFMNLSSDGAGRGIEFGAPTGSVVSPVYIKVVSTGARFSIVNQTDSENLTILDSGNVGIGTTNPSQKLDVYGAGDISAVFKSTNAGSEISLDATNGYASLRIFDSGTEKWRIGHVGQSNDFQIWQIGAGERVRITSTGNVGIGTTNPIAFSGQTHHTVNYSGDGTQVSGYNLMVNGTRYASFISYPSNSEALRISSHSASLPMIFQTNDQTRITIKADGNVGIGTTNPTDKLHIVGTTLIEAQGLANKGSLTIKSTDPFIRLENSNGISDNAKWDIRNIGASGFTLLEFRTINDTNTVFDTKVVFKTNGNVGIGTTNPAAKLHVAGGRIIVENTSDPAIEIRDGSGSQAGFFFHDSTYDNLVIRHADVNGENHLVLTNSGNVGIGTTNPLAKLSVGSGSISDPNVPIQINAPTGQIIYYGANKNGSYGGLFGHDFSLGGVVVRSVDPLDSINLVVNNTTLGLRVTSSGNVGIGTTNPGFRLEVNGSFAATTKSFVIPHPSKPNYQLRYACLEGPENSVYVRGRTQENVIELPDYWVDLVHEDSITVSITPVGNKRIWIEEINSNKVYINSEDTIDCHYIVFAERKDVEKLVVEIEEN